jgi:hypothetical protein
VDEAPLHVLRAARQVRLLGRGFDMDFFDPSCAPGVCTPAWGGVSAGEGLALIAALDGLQILTTRCMFQASASTAPPTNPLPTKRQGHSTGRKLKLG